METNINCSPSIRSKRRSFLKLWSGGVAFCWNESIEYHPIENETNIECSFFWAPFVIKWSKNFCIIQRPQSLKLNQCFLDLENFVHFLKSLNEENLIFGDFNSDTLKREKNHDNLLRAYVFRIQFFVPTPAAPTSKNYIDLWLQLYNTRQKLC